tara:strand:+ start:218 stop:1108 length:891 start_codon:yes stop_codon:yes gene_type:complete
MSEESGEPTPPKLKLSSSRNQLDKPQSALSASAPSSDNASLSSKTDTSPLETPIAASKPAPVLKATPPPVKVTPPTVKATPAPVKATPPPVKLTPPPQAQKPAPRTSGSASAKIKEPATEAPEKDNPLSSILIVAAILFILAAAAGGIWFLLRSDEPELVEGTEIAAPAAAPTNPVERAKATIAAVPDRNLDKALDTESAPEPSTQAAAEPIEAELSAVEPSPVIPNSLKESVSKYLQNIHIGGIRTGVRARIMLDGENYNINETVDAATGLVFIGTRDQRLLFKDRNGTIYVKSF